MDAVLSCSAIAVNRLVFVEYEECARVVVVGVVRVRVVVGVGVGVGVVGVRVFTVLLPVGIPFLWNAPQHIPHESTHGTHDKNACGDFVREGCSVALTLSPSSRWWQHRVVIHLNMFTHILSGIWHENSKQTKTVMNTTTSTKNVLDTTNSADTIRKRSR